VKLVLFGATGMLGQAALRECLLDPEVTQVVAVGRSPCGRQDPKLEDVVVKDLFDLSPVEARLRGVQGAISCAGPSAAGLSEAEYTRLTYDLNVGWARTLLALNPGMSFAYVSGSGTDASERGRTMWARVKGRTENELLRMPFAHVHVLRPAYIQPLHGGVSRTASYRMMYAVMAPLYPLWKVLFPGLVTTTEGVGRALVRAVKTGAPRAVLEVADLNAFGADGPPVPR
jgi:uncharacterized protein YbjT (DUF2867 family)